MTLPTFVPPPPGATPECCSSYKKVAANRKVRRKKSVDRSWYRRVGRDCFVRIRRRAARTATISPCHREWNRVQQSAVTARLANSSLIDRRCITDDFFGLFILIQFLQQLLYFFQFLRR